MLLRLILDDEKRQLLSIRGVSGLETRLKRIGRGIDRRAVEEYITRLATYHVSDRRRLVSSKSQAHGQSELVGIL